MAVQSATISSGFAASVDVALPSPVTAGATLIVAIEANGTDPTTVTDVSDDLNGAWTRVVVHSFLLDFANEVSLWRLDGAAAGTTTITVSLNGAYWLGAVAAEYPQRGPLVGSSVGDDGASVTSHSASLTATATADVLAFFGDEAAPTTVYSTPAGFVSVNQVGVDETADAALFEITDAAPGSYTATSTSADACQAGVLLVALGPVAPVITIGVATETDEALSILPVPPPPPAFLPPGVERPGRAPLPRRS